MQTKSNIQLLRESLKNRESFKDSVKSLIDRYLVEDSYIGFDGKYIKEYTKGYFVIENEFDNIDQAVDAMSNGWVLRIIENKTFQIGRIYDKLSDAKGDNIIDIATGSRC